ncbi:hypothetical protein [Herbidospora sp. RD11066]
MGREHKGVSREELKQSAVVTVTVLLALGLVAAWTVLIPGVMAWDNIVIAVIGSVRLTGPVACAFAAWVAVRKRRAKNRPEGWRVLKAPLAILAVVVGSFGATALVLSLRAVADDQVGRLLPSGLAMGAAGLVLYVVIGWLIGWLVPYPITPMLAGFCVYAAFTWISARTTWADRLAPGTREPYDLFEGLSTTAFLDQTLWLLGLSAALLMGWTAVVTRHSVALAAAMLAVLAAGVGVARLVTDHRPHPGQVAYSCQDWPITVCVHPGMKDGLPELGTTFTGIAARLSGTPAAFNRVEQHSRKADGTLQGGVVPIHVDDLGTGYADRAAREFVERLSRPCPAQRGAGYREIVLAWLRGEPLPPGDYPEHQTASAWFAVLTEQQRREWLRMYYADFANCRLQAAHFGAAAYTHPVPSPTVMSGPEAR